MIKRVCRLCNSKELIPIISLGDQYLSDFLEVGQKTVSFPLDLVLCKKCSLLQLRHTTPPQALYTERYGYRSGINATMRKELKDIVSKAKSHIKNSSGRKVVVDIGANDGTLLSFYPKDYIKVAVEPVKKLAKASGKYADVVVNDFFNFKSYFSKMKDKKADIITAISCFYDIDEPNTFVADVKKILSDDGVLVIQQNYLVEMIRQNAFDNIVHEHLEYYSISSMKKLLDRHDLEIFDVEVNDTNGGSFRTFIKRKGASAKTKNLKKYELMEKKMNLDDKKPYMDFAKRIEKIKTELSTFIKNEIKKGKTIYVYGASTRGNTLLQYCKLDKKLIKAAVERNPEKWGKTIASVGIPIVSEEEARKNRPDYMLVLPWFFKEEFLKREQKFLKSGGHFIFPLPKLHIV